MGTSELTMGQLTTYLRHGMILQAICGVVDLPTSHLEDLQGLERDSFCSDLVPLVSKKKHGVYMAFFFERRSCLGVGRGNWSSN